MYLFLFICTLLVPVSMTVIGLSYRKHPPQDRNGLLGYKTAMSRLNKDTWDYVQKYAGKLWMILGMGLTVVTVLVMIAVKENAEFETYAVILTFSQLAVMALTIIPVEIRLNRVFDKNGRKK
ncbi:MAG: SdpI family protein [Eubacteriales bacterium]|nr:SdpI family protein [Eubacteriales bacterium]